MKGTGLHIGPTRGHGHTPTSRSTSLNLMLFICKVGQESTGNQQRDASARKLNVGGKKTLFPIGPCTLVCSLTEEDFFFPIGFGSRVS